MSGTDRTVLEIIAEARAKFTVHGCDDCDRDKSCEIDVFDSDECKQFRKSWMLDFGIEDGEFSNLLDRIEAAAKREEERRQEMEGGEE